MARRQRTLTTNYVPPPPGSLAARAVMTPPPDGPLVRLSKKEVCGRLGLKPVQLREHIRAGLIPPGVAVSEHGLIKVWYEFWLDAIDRIQLEDAQQATAGQQRRTA